jgi:hypothetical protein
MKKDLRIYRLFTIGDEVPYLLRLKRKVVRRVGVHSVSIDAVGTFYLMSYAPDPARPRQRKRQWVNALNLEHSP